MALRNPSDSKLLKRRNKYRAQCCECDGYKFDSRAEMRRYSTLALLHQKGFISGLVVHPKFSLTVNEHHICDYEADFDYRRKPIDDSIIWTRVVEDVKSPITARIAATRIKLKLVKALYDIDVKIVLT